MILHYSTHDSMGVISPAGSADCINPSAIASEIHLLAEFLKTPALKAALILVDDRFGEQRETALPEKLLYTIAQAQVPIAAVVSGSCRGNGLALACACHFRFAAEESMIHFPSITRQGVFGALLRDMGIASETVAMVLSGKNLSAAAAKKAGFIDSLAHKDTVADRTRDYLQSLTLNRPSKCIRAAMQSISAGYTLSIDEALREENRLFDERVQEMLGETAATIPHPDRNPDGTTHQPSIRTTERRGLSDRTVSSDYPCTLTSVVEALSIESCGERRDEHSAAFFTDEEHREMHGRPVQSVAGIRAVKRALLTLCRSLHPEGVFDEQSFTIKHNDNGAPAIGRFPDFSVNGRMFTKKMFSISLSHTRTTAYGLAVVQEHVDGRGADPI